MVKNISKIAVGSDVYYIKDIDARESLTGKQDAMEISSASGASLTAEVNKYYKFASSVGTLAITLPTPSDTTHLSNIIFSFTTSSSPAITISSASTIQYQYGYQIDGSSTYEVNALFNGTCWIITALKIIT